MLQVIKVVLLIILIFVVLGALRTWELEKTSSQSAFILGQFPNPSPDGFYSGRETKYKLNWLGKEFDVKNSTGINVFKVKDGITKRFPFKTYGAQGLRDKNIKVLKIDYDISQNPIWLRLVKDEIVQIREDKYLGKAHLDLIPTFPFTVAFFSLEK
ncbi:hypothetical protein HYS97_00265 [Candidatus Daviesbacteria bacterium]|nr:hypothetical protein [Candidatus Daviesbacteria bacterium]